MRGLSEMVADKCNSPTPAVQTHYGLICRYSNTTFQKCNYFIQIIAEKYGRWLLSKAQSGFIVPGALGRRGTHYPTQSG